MFKHMALLFFVSSCALFRGEPSLESIDKAKLLEAVKVTGEGKGRLTLGDSQYLFGVDSVLNEDKDWVLAVQIPLHGEEVMILHDLKKVSIDNEETETFELRIAREFKRLKIQLSSEEFLEEMRSLIRFILARELDIKRDCVPQKDTLVCKQDGEIYTIRTEKEEFRIEKILQKNFVLQVVAKNLTKSFFNRTDILLHSSSSKNLNKSSSFSMEFFW